MNQDTEYEAHELRNKPSWDGIDRRKADVAAFQMMVETRQHSEQLEKTMSEKITDMKDDFEAHMVRSELRHKELTDRIDAMSQSSMAVIRDIKQIASETHKLFTQSIPSGDAEGHRRAHEAWIKKQEKDEEFWLDIKKKAVGAAVIALLGWAGMLLWAGFLQGPK